MHAGPSHMSMKITMILLRQMLEFFYKEPCIQDITQLSLAIKSGMLAKEVARKSEALKVLSRKYRLVR